MSHVENELIDMMKKYPSMHSTRITCSHFMFCVLGNGYEWNRNGLLLCADYGESPRDPIVEELEKAKKAHEKEANGHMVQYHLNNASKSLVVLNSLEQRLDDTARMLDGKLYSLCHRSHVVDFPDNVEESHLREMIRMMYIYAFAPEEKFSQPEGFVNQKSIVKDFFNNPIVKDYKGVSDSNLWVHAALHYGSGITSGNDIVSATIKYLDKIIKEEEE